MAAVKALLDVNDRRQSIDYEPLCSTENRMAYTQVSQTEWNNYPYTAILVLGAGPEEPMYLLAQKGSFVLPMQP